MSPLEAKKIIEALANGIDPETGEILPTQSTLNHPQVIRALHAAAQVLAKASKRADRDDAQPSNAGLPWTAEEDQLLLASFDAGAAPKDLAKKHGCTSGAIASRLVRLGRIEERADAYALVQPTAPLNDKHEAHDHDFYGASND